ncbi:MFS transporter [Noviherbaspirillum aerium]|uniref:MFS transporter n=1 Tax=Noviherbaspirillum aerium TaxID=2588497 RepID=UPI00124EB1F9|nr:MFS transporter [Noviherbaspirillum aerium]
MAPFILVTPFAGVWSDRYSKRRFLLAGDCMSIVIAAAIFLALQVSTGTTLAAALLLLNFALASVGATHHPMFQSYAPEILAADSLKRFNAFINAADNLIRVLAPVLVAAALAFTSKEMLLLACGAGFMLSLPLIYLSREPQASGIRRTGILRELADGLRYVLGDANLSTFSLLFFCVNFGLALIGANLVFIFSSIYGVAQEDIGLYYGVIGAGAVTGSFIAPHLMNRFDEAALIVTCCALAGALALLACLATGPLAMSLIWAISTACQSVVVVTFFTFRQRVVPSGLLGRTIGVTRLISYLAIPAASILGGLLLDRHQSAVLVLASGGGAILLGSLIAMRSPAFQHRLARQPGI